MHSNKSGLQGLKWLDKLSDGGSLYISQNLHIHLWS